MSEKASTYRSTLIRLAWLVGLVLVTWGVLTFLGSRTSFLYSIRGLHGSVPPLGTLLDPHRGLWFTARSSGHTDESLGLAPLKEPVTVIRDGRGVPHIFAESERDAIIALGYVVAADRLFQIDFIPRAASGRLSEVFGPGLVEADRFLRSTGMEWAARATLDSIMIENTIERDMLEWFSAGVNARIEELDDHELPIEFRLLGYRPDRYTPLNGSRTIQFMSYDLSFRSDAAAYGRLRELLNVEEFDKLFPRHSHLLEPIIPDAEQFPVNELEITPSRGNALSDTALSHDFWLDPPSVMPGFEFGKGSNSWAVNGSASASGWPLLAGDIHLDLSLPAIWYEVHLVTPRLNTRGAVIPGAPLPVVAFNDRHAWTFTNTGADQIDHYRLSVDSAGTAYRFNEKWAPFELKVDSILVNGVGWVSDTVRFTRFGPVMGWPNDPVAIQWTAHKRMRTLRALWGMHLAEDLESFREALRYWDGPMQNIQFADTEGNIAIWSSGHVPIRRSGHGAGLLDGTTDAHDWVGRIPFESLPHSVNPQQEFLAAANQEPVGSWYPYYLGYDWSRAYRAVRINELLRSKSQHGVGDMMAYQADVQVVQRDLFVPPLDSVKDLSEDARTIRRHLADWSGRAGLEDVGPLLLDEYLKVLARVVWDEFDAEGLRRPRDLQIHRLLTEEPDSRWLDVRSTDLKVERALDVMRLALEETADSIRANYGWDPAGWRWDLHHRLLVRHLTKADALSAMDVGPFSFPGYANTLSPAARRTTTNSASWRMVVDLSSSSPIGYGVYPGGQSGNPYSTNYADQIPTFTRFGYYRLTRPGSPAQIDSRNVASTVVMSPTAPPTSQTDSSPDE